ncbi:MAG: hypothetical protein GEV04_23285, partial [Actinophytocola sp.]|nr:hypothetical protein [Actinophytocola sp.]
QEGFQVVRHKTILEALRLLSWQDTPSRDLHGIIHLGEEVSDPDRTIPRAVLLALAIAVGVYAIVGTAALLAAGPDRLAAAAAPLTEAVHAAGIDSLDPVIRIGGAVASLGALLALLAGVGSGAGPAGSTSSA